MKIATWNVNGIRAREAQVLEWVARERPDVACIQEVKAVPEQVPPALSDLDGYWCCWHGEKGYSGVGLLVRRDLVPERPGFFHPPFDREHRVAAARLAVGGRAPVVVESLYVPNGGKDFAAKVDFLRALEEHVAGLRAEGAEALLCGDLNVARLEIDVHPKERRPDAIGQRPEERERLESILARGGLVDLGRAVDPANEALFTWWPPWRSMRQRNVGWRIDYVLASEALARKAGSCVVQAEVGTSDHAPVLAVFPPA